MVNNLVDIGIKKVGISIDSSDENIHDSSFGINATIELKCTTRKNRTTKLTFHYDEEGLNIEELLWANN